MTDTNISLWLITTRTREEVGRVLCDGYITNQCKTDNRPNHNTDVCRPIMNYDSAFSILFFILLLFIDNCSHIKIQIIYLIKKLKDATINSLILKSFSLLKLKLQNLTAQRSFICSLLFNRFVFCFVFVFLSYEF